MTSDVRPGFTVHPDAIPADRIERSKTESRPDWNAIFNEIREAVEKSKPSAETAILEALAKSHATSKALIDRHVISVRNMLLRFQSELLIGRGRSASGQGATATVDPFKQATLDALDDWINDWAADVAYSRDKLAEQSDQHEDLCFLKARMDSLSPEDAQIAARLLIAPLNIGLTRPVRAESLFAMIKRLKTGEAA